MLGIATRLGIILTIGIGYYMIARFFLRGQDRLRMDGGDWFLLFLFSLMVELGITVGVFVIYILGYWIVTGTTP